MHVGILTASRTNNNGTDLQTAAMYRLLEQTGHDVEVIDYACKKLDGGRRLLPKKNLAGFLRLPWKIYDSFSREQFRQRAFVRSPETYYPENLNLDRYDAVVVGSDQIWNLDITGGDLNFFLPESVGNIKRVAYAPSLGKMDIRHWEQQYALKEKLDRFAGVSVRESSGVAALSQIGVEARHALDPLLCIDRSDWENLAAKPKRREKYIVLYLVGGSPAAERKARSYAKRTGCRILKFGPPQKPTKGIRTLSFVSLPKWIRLMADAQMVFTNSYHGLSVAVALNTNVRVFPLKEEQANARARSLLQMLQMEEYFMESADCTADDAYPDWAKVKKILAEKRKDSESYLIQMLDE